MDDFVNLLRPFRGSDDFSAGGCLRLLYKDMDDDPLTNGCHVDGACDFRFCPSCAFPRVDPPSASSMARAQIRIVSP
jgi:hypothetical protein